MDRRGILAALGTLGAAGLGGCSAARSAVDTALSPDQASRAGDQSELTCDAVEASHLFVVRPDGFTVVLDDRETARTVIDRLRAADALGPGTYYNGHAGSAAGYVVEIDNTSATVADLRSLVGNVAGVRTVRRGVPAASLADRRDRIAARLTNAPNVSDSMVRVESVEPDPPAAPYLVAVLTDPPPELLVRLRSTSATELRVQTANGERTIITGAAVRSEPRLSPVGGGLRVVVPFAHDPWTEFVASLRDAGVLADPGAHPIRVYNDETRIHQFRLTAEFAREIRTGAETGVLAIPVPSYERGRLLVAAFSPPLAGGTLTRCP